MGRSRAAPRPAPARSSGFSSRSSSPPPSRSPPPPSPQQYAASVPARATPAAPPTYQAGGYGGGMGGGLLGMMATGAAMGTGSAMAHRAVDGLLGGGGGHVAAPSAAEPQEQYMAYPPQPATQDACSEQMKQFTDCVSRTGGDMAACNIYFDAMQSCKAKYGQLPQQLQ